MNNFSYLSVRWGAALMAVGVYIRDFGLGVAGAVVERNAEHTIVVIDTAVPERDRYQVLGDMLNDDEIHELWRMWDQLTNPPAEPCQDAAALCQQ